MQPIDSVLASDFTPTYREIAEIVGNENTYKIFMHFRGQTTTFPQRLYSVQYVEKYVREHYDGTNLRTIAKEFGYTERRMRQIMKQTARV